MTTPVLTSKPFTVAFDYALQDAPVIVGIESSVDLVNWKVEAEWPLTQTHNEWTDHDTAAAQKFYRAFARYAD